MRAILFPVVLLTLFAQAQPRLVGTLIYNGPQYGGSVFRTDMPGGGPGVIHSFNNLSPHSPNGGVTAGNAGWLYGVLNYNGTTNSKGGLYKIRQDGTGFAILHDSASGMIPYYHTDDHVYFTGDFKLKKINVLTNAVTEIPVTGFPVNRNLYIDSDDWIYYYTFSTLSKSKTDGSQWTDLHVFDPAADGAGGISVIEVPGNILVGITNYGGASNGGTIFSINKDGTNFTVHHHFTSATGMNPYAKLEYFDGRFFGATTQGGNEGAGTLFTINADGSGYRVLHHFVNAPATPGTFFNISISSNGRIFGSFSQSFQSGFGTYSLFKIDTSGADFEPFCNSNQKGIGTFFQDPLLINDEQIYLTSSEAGIHDGGVLSEIDTSGFGGGLYHFGYSANGFRPANALIRASDGKLYGTTVIGGTDGNGTIYSMNIDGTAYTKLHEFTDAEGFEPSGKLLEASDGKLYGALRQGPAAGVLYRLDKNGSNFQVIHSFNASNGPYSPVGSLVEDNTGRLFGVGFYSTGGGGGLFRINKDGSNYTVLKDFTGTGSDLMFPYNGALLVNDFLYGTCGYGGSQGRGGVYRIKTDGSGYQLMHEFLAGEGELPAATPIIASNGMLYGTTAFGGTSSEGTIYRIDTSSFNFITIVNFSSATDNGAYPWAGLIQASNGLIYGTTDFGGTSNPSNSQIYSMSLTGFGFAPARAFNSLTEGQNMTSLLDLDGNFIPLPVDLLGFDAEKREQATLLTWKTAQEENSSHFEIERATNVNRFIAIGTVTAAGNSNSINHYSFTDLQPMDGVNYYRLKQVDIDGRFTYSKTIPVNFGDPDKMLVSPNPASDRLNIRLPKNKRFTNLHIIDASGRIVMQQSIGASAIDLSLDIHHLPKGWYVLDIKGEISQQQAFLKQ